MKAMVIERFGDASVFKQARAPKPQPQAGEVLIRVKASSVNPLDYKIRNSTLGMLSPKFPAILHGDVAGIIEEIGSDVVNFKVGDAVYGCAGGLLNLSGALAEYMVADAKLLAHKPETLSMAEAAALPLVSITAWEALIRLANIAPQQKVLIHAGVGGVGHIAIQLAKWRQATVFATCSNAEKVILAQQLGADTVINYNVESVANYVEKYTQNNGFDIVFDTVGGENLNASLQAVSPNGQVITLFAAQSYDLTPLFFKGASLHTVMQPNPLLNGLGREQYGEILSKIACLVDNKVLKPLIDEQIFTYTSIADAHAYLENGKAIGKVVVENDL